MDNNVEQQTDQVLKTSILNLSTLRERVAQNPLDLDQIQPETVVLAQAFLYHLHSILAKNGLTWVAPITTEGNGEVTFEWWHDFLSLAIFVNFSGEIEFLRVWGPHMTKEMESGSSPSDEDLILLWNALYTESVRGKLFPDA